MQRLLIIHGPNLNLLGKRPKEHYGNLSLKKINEKIIEHAERIRIDIKTIQSNNESEIIEILQKAENNFTGIILNPAAFTHTSVAIRDCIEAVDIPVIEVHLSNIYAREEFRRKSIIAPVCIGQIAGFGPDSYLIAIDYFLRKGGKNGI
jgi:3-dehydroquinate dehydratase-2